MKPSQILELYKTHLVANGSVLTKNSLRCVSRLINASIKVGMASLTQDFVDKWCEKKDTETKVSCNQRRCPIRQFLRFSNSHGYTNLQIPRLLEIVPKDKRKFSVIWTDKPLNTTSISSFLEQYIQYLKIGSSPKINISTLASLLNFNNFIFKNYPKMEKLTDKMVEKWCCKREKESYSSRYKRVRPVRNFLKYTVSRGLLDVQIPCISTHKSQPRQPHYFTDEELDRFFQSTVKLNSGYRQHETSCILKRMVLPVYFRLLYSTGMRTNEARDLRCEDVNLESGIISIVNTKGTYQHRVALHPSMLELLKRYNSAVEKVLPGRKIFFPTAEDKPHREFWQNAVFRKLWPQVSNEDARPYDFRSTYAIRNINKWTYEGPAWFDKLIYLSRSMGHTAISSTCYYFHLSPMFPRTLEEKTGPQMHSILPDFEKFYDDEE